MGLQFCWLCDINYSFTGYQGTKHLDEDGNAPCVECLQELEEQETDEETDV